MREMDIDAGTCGTGGAEPSAPPAPAIDMLEEWIDLEEDDWRGRRRRHRQVRAC